MAAAPTYDLISTTTVPTTTTYVQLTSFSGYTDLVLVFEGTGDTSGNDLLLRMNNDSSTLYSRTGGYAAVTAQGSFRSNSQGTAYLGAIMNTGRSYIIANIMNYANTQMDKNVLSINSDGPASTAIVFQSNVYRSTSAVTTLDFRADSNSSIAAGSIFYLYGIKEA